MLFIPTKIKNSIYYVLSSLIKMNMVLVIATFDRPYQKSSLTSIFITFVINHALYTCIMGK